MEPLGAQMAADANRVLGGLASRLTEAYYRRCIYCISRLNRIGDYSFTPSGASRGALTFNGYFTDTGGLD